MDNATRVKLVEQYRSGYDAVVRALDGVTDEELDRRPAPGKWTAREIVHHLADSEMTSALMLNGRHDYTFPLKTSQAPFFRWLGTPEPDKRHVVDDSAHDVMVNRTAVVKEVLSWLDQHLGPVAR